MISTTLSSKGQVVIPKVLRDLRQWSAGTRLVIENCPQGVLLRAAKPPLFAPASIDEVIGSIGYDGPPLSDEDIVRALEDEGRRQR